MTKIEWTENMAYRLACMEMNDIDSFVKGKRYCTKVGKKETGSFLDGKEYKKFPK